LISINFTFLSSFSKLIRSSNDWLRSRQLKSAEAWTFLGHVSLHSEESLLTPVGSPGVLDKPVRLTVVSSITDKEDTMIE